MRDAAGRDITYLRISVTDRCNLRCIYCQPAGVTPLQHDDILRYEEIRRICRQALRLGINRFKITGGDPLVRRGIIPFITELKEMAGVDQVTLTTNGLSLGRDLHALEELGLDGLNISLDTRDAGQYAALTGYDGLAVVEEAIAAAAGGPIRTKVNAVLLADTADQILPLAELARDLPVDVRYIEVMPIGEGRHFAGPAGAACLAVLRTVYDDLQPDTAWHGNGPAVYYRSRQLRGSIGFIAAQTHRFCGSCNRLRLTSTGFLKPCLCYDIGTDLRSLLRGGASDEDLYKAMASCLANKPAGHHFENQNEVTEHKKMSQIGG